MGKYFGTDGIRGKANEGLTADRAFQVGRYLGWHFSRSGKNKIIVGKDTRRSSDMLEAALASGIASEGCDVYEAGYGPTPMICWLARKEEFVCGVMISASHNPFYDNGIKIFSKEGIKIPADLETKIEDFIDGTITISYAVEDAIGSIHAYPDGIMHYMEAMKAEFPLCLSGFRIAMDCANGSASFTAEKIFRDLGAEVTVLNDHPDGLNINADCGSTHPQAFQKFMREHHGAYDLGLMFDGDADRQILVRPDGELLNGDFILYIIGRYYKEKGTLSGNTIVTTVMANLGLWKAMAAHGIHVEKTQVGDKYVYERMCEKGCIIGGEQSGHIILKHHATTGDGLLTALAIVKIMQATGKSIVDLCHGLKIYPQELMNVRVRDKNLAMKDEEIMTAISDMEAALHGNGRVLVRPSGTEPLIRVMVEAETDALCKEMVEKVASIVRRKYGI